MTKKQIQFDQLNQESNACGTRIDSLTEEMLTLDVREKKGRADFEELEKQKDHWDSVLEAVEADTKEHKSNPFWFFLWITTWYLNKRYKEVSKAMNGLSIKFKANGAEAEKLGDDYQRILDGLRKEKELLLDINQKMSSLAGDSGKDSRNKILF